MYVCMYACMYVCMFVCVYVFMFPWRVTVNPQTALDNTQCPRPDSKYGRPQYKSVALSLQSHACLRRRYLSHLHSTALSPKVKKFPVLVSICRYFNSPPSFFFLSLFWAAAVRSSRWRTAPYLLCIQLGTKTKKRHCVSARGLSHGTEVKRNCRQASSRAS